MINPFKITRARKPDGNQQIVAAYLPQELADDLALYAVYRGVAKQTIMKEIIRGHLTKEIGTPRIIERLADRALSHWRTEWRGNLGKRGWENDIDEAKRLDEYCMELKKALATRGVTKTHINEILKPLKAERNK